MWDSRAAEREVTSDAEDPRPVLLVFVIAFGRGEKGGRVVLVYQSARAARGRESVLRERQSSLLFKDRRLSRSLEDRERKRLTLSD